MLDFRYETFLVLYKIKNYTKTADFLHVTQPAVTQHIHFLEEYYGVKLFCYEGKKLVLTKEGEKLQAFAMTVKADVNHMREVFFSEDEQHTLNFGATLTIGEYIMPSILGKLMDMYPNIHINMLVNLKVLKNYVNLGTMNTIKLLVANNYGITFLYHNAAEKEISRGELCKIEIEDFSV